MLYILSKQTYNHLIFHHRNKEEQEIY